MITLWQAPEEMAARVALCSQYESILSKQEKKIFSMFRRPDKAQNFILGRIMTRLALAKELACEPEAILLERKKTGKWFLPQYPRLVFCLSHSGSEIVLAVGKGEALGVDIEQKKNAQRALTIAQHYFTTSEIARLNKSPDKEIDALKLWSLKESVVKALGLTVWQGIAGVELRCGAREAFHLERLPDNRAINYWQIAIDDLNKDVILSLAFWSSIHQPLVYKRQILLA